MKTVYVEAYTANSTATGAVGLDRVVQASFQLRKKEVY